MLDRVPREAAQRFQVLVDGLPASPEPRVTTVVDDDAVVVTVWRDRLAAAPAVIRPCRDPTPPVEALLWSPVEGTVLVGDTVANDGGWPVGALPQASVVICGAGALGSWASASSRHPS